MVSPSRLHQAGMVDSKNRIKILGSGKIDKKLNVYAHRFSETAENAINKAGGRVHVIRLVKRMPQKHIKDNKK